MIPIEDSFSDIIGKAQRGLKFSDDQLAQKAGVTVPILQSVKSGEFDESAVQKLAPVLNLKGDCLVDLAKKTWYPKQEPIPDGLVMFTTQYEDMTVNSYLAWDPQSKIAVAFDTGADSTGLSKAAQEKGLKIQLILITHTHADHIADLARLKNATGAKAYVCELEAFDGAESFAAGKQFTAGKLEIKTLQTSGHAVGGISFLISGLAKPIVIVGDSIFAGSMGGGMISYADALRNNREKILTLPDDTIICSGHGPLTTVGEEKQHNAFFP